jgi:hypothetical protein
VKSILSRSHQGLFSTTLFIESIFTGGSITLASSKAEALLDKHYSLFGMLIPLLLEDGTDKILNPIRTDEPQKTMSQSYNQERDVLEWLHINY